MTFSFRQVTISGANQDVEGTSAALNEITDVLVNEMGWVLEDDRRSQAGSFNETLTHKVVFNSNGGESGTEPNWYLTLTSGTSVTVGQDFLGTKIHSAYDTGTHDTAASGIESPTTLGTYTLTTDSDGHFVMWISGDKDGIAVVTNTTTRYNYLLAGRGTHFLDNSFEPYGLHLLTGANSTNPAVTAVRGIIGDPPEAVDNANEAEFLVYSLGVNNQPRAGFQGADEAQFTALPIVYLVDDSSPSRKGAIAVLTQAWSCATADAGWVREAVITVPGTPDKEYIAFPDGTNGLVIRKS